MEEEKKYYAHSLQGRPPSEWQPLEEHLENVAKLAAEFAKPFGGQEWARLAGLWHDLGKYQNDWQAYLRRANNIVDEFQKYYTGHPTHALLGAKRLYAKSKEAGKILAYCVAGHHGGLPNWNDDAGSALKMKLCGAFALDNPPPLDCMLPTTLPFTVDTERFGFQLQFFIRMVFSCLVDADYLDTESFMDGGRAEFRSVNPEFQDLFSRFWVNYNVLRRSADRTTNVNIQRECVLDDCLKAARNQNNIFSLTVPTGGGKTLASLAFALEYAKHNINIRKIIYVIPFTSIIEQNAAVFRKMLGDDAVLEHHCNFIPDDTNWISALAIENWDAPVVVTTNVQFFNSFWSNKTSKCRKLHNVSDSIVIFDEVQAIPVEKLKPCLEVVQELSMNYGVVSVLCTATQPSIEYSAEFESGLKNVKEIIRDVPSLFNSLKRTKESFVGELTEEKLAEKLSTLDQVLCIVNTRQQALNVYKHLSDIKPATHLSAIMHPAHRTKKLTKIRECLSNGLPCRVVSTQLIEAGVDVDFPCVFRAVSGIDNIAQAAGRCNRNGEFSESCDVFIFQFPEQIECSFFKKASQSALKLFDKFEFNLTSPECVHQYFMDYFWKNEHEMDCDQVVSKCKTAQSGNVQFKELAEFKMINSASIPIVIALEQEAIELTRSLEFVTYNGGILRKLQKYTVQVYSHQFVNLRPWLESPAEGVWILTNNELYSDETGLVCEPPESTAFFG